MNSSGLPDFIASAISKQQANVCHFSSDCCHHSLPLNGLVAESIISSIIELAYSNLSLIVALFKGVNYLFINRFKCFEFLLFHYSS